MPREQLVTWTTPAGSNFVSVLFYDSALGVVADERAALDVFLTAVSELLGTNIDWVIEPTGRILDDSTGGLTGFWSEPTVHQGSGTAVSGAIVPDASQILLRWRTSTVTSGRLLQGRTYIPGLWASAVDDGEIDAEAFADLTSFVNTFVPTSGLVIWHRPTGGSGGSTADVTSGSVWNELAVLRNRRG